jgi:hypothetical protein
MLHRLPPQISAKRWGRSTSMAEPSTPDPVERAVGACRALSDLVDAAYRLKSGLPEGWEAFDGHLETLRQDGDALAGYLSRVAPSLPDPWGRVHGIIDAFAEVKWLVEGRPWSVYSYTVRVNQFQDARRTLARRLAPIWAIEAPVPPGAPAEPGRQGGAGPPAAPAKEATRLVVDLERMTAALDGTTYDVKSECALRWLKVLVEHPGEWISGKELKKHDKILYAPRTNRWQKQLPGPIRLLINSEPGRGSRINL